MDTVSHCAKPTSCASSKTLAVRVTQALHQLLEASWDHSELPHGAVKGWETYPSLLRTSSETQLTEQDIQRICNVGEAQGVKSDAGLTEETPPLRVGDIYQYNICYVLMSGISYDFLNENDILCI